MHIYNVSKIDIFYSEMIFIFSLVSDTIHIFTVAKQGFLGSSGTWTFFKRF